MSTGICIVFHRVLILCYAAVYTEGRISSLVIQGSFHENANEVLVG